MKPYYSIVVPVYNEEKNLEELFLQLMAALRSLAKPWEIIFVNDGSRDQSLEMLTNFTRKDKTVRVVSLSRNFGQQAAVTAGLANSSGQVVALMDADLQDPPETLLKLLGKVDEGFDVAYAVSKKRHDPPLRKFLINNYYRVMNLAATYEIPPGAGIFSALSRRTVDTLLGLSERNRFLPALRSWVGFKQIAVPFEKPARFAGKESQSLAKLFKMGFDALFSFSYLPLRLATILGLLVSTVAFVSIVDVLYQKLVAGTAILGWASPLVATLFIGGVQLLILGIIGEYLGRIYDEVKHRPYYIIAEKIGF
ncbi:MAG: glycosyltransferase family 2 protein [Patescibacteria group bacterium]|nr:glycosyltransferase family 2 protein [Patescibacteria group bacterium]MCL5431551.1 glycosyltransferase family 2 protein [Patescibacteria group bacterium]